MNNASVRCPSVKVALALREAACQAREQLDAFAALGVRRFALYLFDINKKCCGSIPNCPWSILRSQLADSLTRAATIEANLYLRPLAVRMPLVQLDDLDKGQLDSVSDVAFLALTTAPGEYQAWLAVADAEGDFKSRLRKAVVADAGATGTLHVSGSRNIQPRFRRDFPYVQNVLIAKGRIVRMSDLKDLLSAPTPAASR